MVKRLFLVAVLHICVVVTRAQHQVCDTILWQADRKLSLKDFGATADSNSAVGALSFISIQYLLEETETGYQLTALNYFEPCKSWYKKQVSTLSLQHEQIHFNIDEYIRRLFVATVAERNNFSRFTLNGVSDIYKSMLRYRNFMHRRFDVESDYHRDSEKEKEWSNDMARRIERLSGYSKLQYNFKAGKPRVAPFLKTTRGRKN